MVIFKYLSLKALSHLQKHEGVGGQGNKNNYTNDSLKLCINIHQYINAQSIHCTYSLTLSFSPLPLSLSSTHTHTKTQGSLFATDIKMCIGICLGDITFTCKQYLTNKYTIVINNTFYSDHNYEHVVQLTQALPYPSAPTHS